MRKIQNPKSWSNPYPRWVIKHSLTARYWLIVVTVLVIIGVTFSYIQANIYSEAEIAFKDFPKIDSAYKAITKYAQSKHPGAQLVMMTIFGRNSSYYDKNLEYEMLFYFCTPDNKEPLKVVSDVRTGVFWKSYPVVSSNFVPPSAIISCEQTGIKDIDTDIILIKEVLHTNLPENQLAPLEYMPRAIRIFATGSDIVWEIIFKYSDEDMGLHLLINSTTGKITNSQEIYYPEKWQRGKYRPPNFY